MKVVQRSLFLTCLYLFLGQGVSTYGSTMVGDVLIETLSNGLLYCDSLVCPQGTAKCHVTKRNDPNDFNIIIRQRRCIAPNGYTLQEEILNEPNKYLGSVNVNVVSGGGINSNSGRPLTPQEKKELDEFLEQTQKNVQSQVSGTLNQIQSSLGQFLNGNFAANLNQQIAGSLQNALRF